MKVGIFGGTFNPPHNTHIQIAVQAVRQLGLDKLIVVPGGMPPHKFCAVDKQARFEMAQLAFADLPVDAEVAVSDVELLREGKTYTSDTVKYFADVYPDAELYFIVGGDSFRQFDTWHCPDEIVTYVTLAVAAREQAVTDEEIQSFAKRYGSAPALINVVPDKVSSSEIRQRYQFGMDVTDVPVAVNGYVLANGLYAEYRPMAQKLRSYLTPKRFSHTFYVVKRGLQLAADDMRDKVFVTCLLHDCAKYITADRYADYGFVRPDDMPESVVHAFLGELVAKQDFGITDPDILQAIRYHCTARPQMTTLDKIVYVADKTEETRPYPVAHLLQGTLDDMFVACLEEANRYCLANHGDNVYYLTLQALRYYGNAK